MKQHIESDYNIYIEIIRDQQLRSKWIRIDKMQGLLKKKIDINSIRKSKFFLYNPMKDAVKACYPFVSIVNFETLIDFLDNNRCGVEADIQLQLAYPGIISDLIELENRKWVSYYWKKNNNDQLIKVYLVDHLNFKKEIIIDVLQTVPTRFQFQFNPNFFLENKQVFDLQMQMESVLSIQVLQKYAIKNTEKSQQIKNTHLFQSNENVYRKFKEALKEYQI